MEIDLEEMYEEFLDNFDVSNPNALLDNLLTLVPGIEKQEGFFITDEVDDSGNREAIPHSWGEVTDTKEIIDPVGYQFLFEKAFDLDKSRYVKSKRFLQEKTKGDVGLKFYSLQEGRGFTIPQLRRDAPNPHEKNFYKIRMSQGTSGISLVYLEWLDEDPFEDKNSSLALTFFINPTWTRSVEVYTPLGVKTRDSKYVVIIKFVGVNDYIESKFAFMDLDMSEQKKLMKEFIKTCEVKVWASDPSWIFQGHYENATELNYSIYPWPRSVPKATGRWAKIKTGKTGVPYFSVSKHMIEVFNKIHLISDKICKLIQKKYKRDKDKFDKQKPVSNLSPQDQKKKDAEDKKNRNKKK